MCKYLLLKNNTIVCEYGYNGTSLTTYTLDQRGLAPNDREYQHTCLSEVLQSGTNLSILQNKQTLTGE